MNVTTLYKQVLLVHPSVTDLTDLFQICEGIYKLTFVLDLLENFIYVLNRIVRILIYMRHTEHSSTIFLLEEKLTLLCENQSKIGGPFLMQ